jgi:hypothetical protein
MRRPARSSSGTTAWERGTADRDPPWPAPRGAGPGCGNCPPPPDLRLLSRLPILVHGSSAPTAERPSKPRTGRRLPGCPHARYQESWRTKIIYGDRGQLIALFAESGQTGVSRGWLIALRLGVPQSVHRPPVAACHLRR